MIKPPNIYVMVAFRKLLRPNFHALKLESPRIVKTALLKAKKFKKINR